MTSAKRQKSRRGRGPEVTMSPEERDRIERAAEIDRRSLADFMRVHSDIAAVAILSSQKESAGA